MVFCSWLVSLVLSSVQAIMFRQVKHPNMEFYQCTSEMVVEMNSKMVIENGKAKFTFFGIDSEVIYTVYHFSFLFFVSAPALPLLVVVLTGSPGQAPNGVHRQRPHVSQVLSKKSEAGRKKEK